MNQAQVRIKEASLIQPLIRQNYPHYIKYMGSKTKIMDFVIEGLNEVYDGGAVCDLFAGSASLAGAIGKQVPIISNDIQNYSSVIADAYLNAWKPANAPSAEEILRLAESIVHKHAKTIGLHIDYSALKTLNAFNAAEQQQQQLIYREFRRPWHLFAKFYSGTWWSLKQCLWIDAIREVSESYRDSPLYSTILSSLMFSMAYTSQGTGHYAQYRDAKTASSMKDISIYRNRDVPHYFRKKYDDVVSTLPDSPPDLQHRSTHLDFKECLQTFEGGTVYADPPYCFVHYSRFYHALETLVLYDYPQIQHKNGGVVKGRYREDRHQSPFCIHSKVKGAFNDLFAGVKKNGANLVLSYSNTGMITIDEITEIATQHFNNRSIEILFTDHQHMTLGRQYDRHRQVEECLILVK